MQRLWSRKVFDVSEVLREGQCVLHVVSKGSGIKCVKARSYNTLLGPVRSSYSVHIEYNKKPLLCGGWIAKEQE